MKVQHELTIRAKCPVNDGEDEYRCTVETECLIKVEDILEVCRKFEKEPIFQEVLCCEIAKQLGNDARVTLVGTHSNVKTTVTCDAFEG